MPYSPFAANINRKSKQTIQQNIVGCPMTSERQQQHQQSQSKWGIKCNKLSLYSISSHISNNFATAWNLFVTEIHVTRLPSSPPPPPPSPIHHGACTHIFVIATDYIWYYWWVSFDLNSCEQFSIIHVYACAWCLILLHTSCNNLQRIWMLYLNSFYYSAATSRMSESASESIHALNMQTHSHIRCLENDFRAQM